MIIFQKEKQHVDVRKRHQIFFAKNQRCILLSCSRCIHGGKPQYSTRQVTETGLGLRGDVILHTISIPTPYLCSIPCRSYVPRLISVVPHYLGYLISYYKPHIMTRCDGRTGPAAEMKSSCKFLVRTCSGSGTGSARAAARARWRRRGCRVD